MNEEQAFLSAIEANPTESGPKLRYADWLDERGRGSDANAMRWLAAKGKFPYLASGYQQQYWMWGIDWPKFLRNTNGYLSSEAHYLPREIYLHLERHYMNKSYSTFQDAIQWFFIAFEAAQQRLSWFWRLFGYRAWVPDYNEPPILPRGIQSAKTKPPTPPEGIRSGIAPVKIYQ